uniref:Large ribosomal subunit protein uL13m n=1 Tax=Sinocyclocheilus grahami TaxID=75366 RepID=A0A672LRA4_SINGR
MSSFSRSAQQWATFARSWFLIDARMQPPGKIASMCSVRLQGKHKPIYHPMSDIGDHVVVMNTRHIAFSGNKWEQKVYSSHTGYPGSFKQLTAAQMHKKDPTAVSILLQIFPHNQHATHLNNKCSADPILPSSPSFFQCLSVLLFSQSVLHRTLSFLSQRQKDFKVLFHHTFYKIRCLSVVLRICKSFTIILSVISPYSVYVVSEMLCTVM